MTCSVEFNKFLYVNFPSNEAEKHALSKEWIPVHFSRMKKAEDNHSKALLFVLEEMYKDVPVSKWPSVAFTSDTNPYVNGELKSTPVTKHTLSYN